MKSSQNTSLIRADFPHPHRLGGTELFRELLGDVGGSTFARYLAQGTLPPPDVKVGGLSRWFETTMANAIEDMHVHTKALYDEPTGA